jgi:type I restriction enzyme S subunit
MASAGETVDDIGKSVAWLGDEPVVIHDACYAFTSDLDPKFVSYFFSSRGFREQIRQRVASSKVSSISTQSVAKALIPVPPLRVQLEVVHVLDRLSFLQSELESLLEAELEARRGQYEYYRRVLLDSSDGEGFRDMSLGDLIRPNFGTRITKKDDAGTAYPVYGGGGESFRTDAFNRENEWVVSRFAMSANCVRRVSGKFWMLDSGFTFDLKDDAADKEFVGQLLLSLQPVIFATSTQSAQKNIDVDGFKRLRVRLPSLAHQREVASRLSEFDALVADLQYGLPAELAARRKQYEYYRDKLLTFEEAPA